MINVMDQNHINIMTSIFNFLSKTRKRNRVTDPPKNINSQLLNKKESEEFANNIIISNDHKLIINIFNELLISVNSVAESIKNGVMVVNYHNVFLKLRKPLTNLIAKLSDNCLKNKKVEHNENLKIIIDLFQQYANKGKYDGKSYDQHIIEDYYMYCTTYLPKSKSKSGKVSNESNLSYTTANNGE